MRLGEFLQQGGLINDTAKIQGIIHKYGRGRSPLTASDYIEVSKSTGIPVELLLAQGIAESNLGTAGRAVRTKNVGNVGNTDSGAEEHRNSWKDGLYRQANLLKKEYKVSGPQDVQRLVSNNFARPSGGNYASARDYGVKVGNIMNTIAGSKFSLPSTGATGATGADGAQLSDPSQYNDLIADMQKGLFDYSKISEMYKKDPTYTSMVMDNVQNQNQLAESNRLEQERQKQEQNKLAVEQENARIDQELLDKNAQRKQLLSMVPQAQSINSGQIQPIPQQSMQSGGTINPADDGVLSYNDYSKSLVEDTRDYFRGMTESDWYAERLGKTGYNDPQKEARDRGNTLDEMKFTYQDKPYSKLRGTLNNIVGNQTAYGDQGSFYSPSKNQVTFVNEDRTNLGISSESLLGHEVSHGINMRMNQTEEDMIRNSVTNEKADDHSSNPGEIKGDLDSLRYMLYKKDLFNPETGQYNTPDGKFDKSLIEGLDEELVPARLRNTIGTDNMKNLLDTIAQNNRINTNSQI